MNEDEAIKDLHRKIERERAIINAANAMRQATNNAQVNSRVESQIRDARRNMQYFEQTLADLQHRKMAPDMGNLSISENGGRPPPPPKNGSRGMDDYNQGGGPGMRPPQPSYAQSGPSDRRQRPNYSKLGMYRIISFKALH
jgi:classical protein kinase C